MTEVLNLEDNHEQSPLESKVAPSSSYVSKLVGEGKKFQDVEALAKGKLESDNFVEQLKTEGAALRDRIRELEDMIKTKEVRDELNDLRKQLAQKPKDDTLKEPNPSPSVSPDELKSLIDQHLTDRELKQSARTNVDQTNAALVKAFGTTEKAQAVIQERAQALGMSLAEVTAVAAKSPSAALAMLGVTAQAPVKSALTKGSSVQDIAKSDNEFESKAYFDNLRRTNWSAYWSPSVQNRIFQLKKEGKI